jgi:hypothetical protein
MVGYENLEEGTGQGKVKRLGYINQKWVNGLICRKLLAEHAGM